MNKNMVLTLSGVSGEQQEEQVLWKPYKSQPAG